MRRARPRTKPCSNRRRRRVPGSRYDVWTIAAEAPKNAVMPPRWPKKSDALDEVKRLVAPPGDTPAATIVAAWSSADCRLMVSSSSVLAARHQGKLLRFAHDAPDQQAVGTVREREAADERRQPWRRQSFQPVRT